MDALKIKGTDDTPEVLLDKSKGVFQISGRSLPEDSVEFFDPVLNWIESYKKDPNPTTAFVFKMEYANTASSKLIQTIISELESIKGIKIEWYFREDDEDMKDAGYELSELVKIPFEFKNY